MSGMDNIALVPQPRSTVFLNRAKNPTRSREERYGCWLMSCEAFWFESVTERNFPLLAVPHEFQATVRERIFRSQTIMPQQAA